jgi:hypothetical protein
MVLPSSNLNTADAVRLAVQERASGEQHGRHEQPAVRLAAWQVSGWIQHAGVNVL